jgi:MFS family permease
MEGSVAALSHASPPEQVALTRLQSAAIMSTISSISFLNTFNSGLLTVALPAIAADLSLPPNLLLWPASVYALALSCTLLLTGAVADVLGNRPLFLVGTLLFATFTLACSLARTGIELIAFRALQGVAMSFCMPTSVGVITSSFPSGRKRNIAFATFGGGSPLGFALGLVMGGVFVQTVGWRVGYYLSCGISVMAFVAAWFTIPKSAEGMSSNKRKRLAKEVDWVGVGISSACLALLSYVFR